MPTRRAAAAFAIAFAAGLILLPLVALMIALPGWLSVDAMSSPSSWEENVAHTALAASLARRADGLTNPVAGNDADLRAGMKIFLRNCAGCHGDASGPSPWGSRNFYPRVPQFAQHPSSLSPAQMFVAIKYGIRYTGMGAWNDQLPDRDIWLAATFLSRVGLLPPAVAATWNARH